MSEEAELLYAEKSSDQRSEPISWHRTWTLALIQPSIKTFERIIRDPNASAGRAFSWIFIAFMIGSLIQALFALPGMNSALISSITQGMDTLPGTSTNPEEILTPFFALICAPVLALLQIFGFVVIVAARQWIAVRVLGGSGTYASLAYATSAYLSPLYIISSLLVGFPELICLSVALSIFGTMLDVMAVKAVNRIDWGRAVVSVIGGSLLVMFVTAVFTVCVLIILGPAINDVFQNTIKELESGGVHHALSLSLLAMSRLPGRYS